VRERPILFSGPMVRAILDGRKSQTRRVIKGAPHEERQLEAVMVRDEACFIERAHVGTPQETCHYRYGGEGEQPAIACPYGAPGDKLWVRETWGLNHYEYERAPIPKVRPPDLEDQYLAYQATEDDSEVRNELRWRPSIHMPRWMSRLTLEIAEVRAERLLACSENDAKAEGLEWTTPGMWSVATHLPIIGDDPRRVYFELWDHINGAGSAAADPWVWAVSFRVLDEAAQ
jgi:hypothetical protein